MTGTVFNIQKFCINDGPGIRTTVFVKGCPLNCAWCHNPESKNSEPELLYDKNKCTMCGKCADVCPNNCHSFENGEHTIDREKCIRCGKCAEFCYFQALEMAGNVMDSDEVLKEVLKDKAFYETSGGGLTVSGGEPMLHFDFTYELLKKAKEEGLHTAMETCGFAPEEKYIKIAEVTDLFLFDFKLWDADLHKKYIGADNSLILKNLEMLNEIGASIILRCPIIPTINDNSEHFKAIADTANRLKNVLEINIEPYHPLGENKNQKLGKESILPEIKMPENETVENWIKAIQEMTETPVKKG